MSATTIILIVIAVTIVGVGIYTLLFGSDRRQARIEDTRTETIERLAAPGAPDLDPTHLDRP